MKTQLLEFISLIGAGCMREEDIERIADEAAQAYADPAAFLAANPDINYDDSFPIPLGEWVVLGSLPDTVVFQADSYQDLFQQISDSFDQLSMLMKPGATARPWASISRRARPGACGPT